MLAIEADSKEKAALLGSTHHVSRDSMDRGRVSVVIAHESLDGGSPIRGTTDHRRRTTDRRSASVVCGPWSVVVSQHLRDLFLARDDELVPLGAGGDVKRVADAEAELLGRRELIGFF